MLVVNTLTMLTIAHTDRGGPYRLHICTLNKCTRSILFKCEEIEYDIQFFSCSCLLTKSERQKIIRKHKSTTQKRLLADKSKEENAKMYLKELLKQSLIHCCMIWIIIYPGFTIKEGSYICSVCNQLLYRESVMMSCVFQNFNPIT